MNSKYLFNKENLKLGKVISTKRKSIETARENGTAYMQNYDELVKLRRVEFHHQENFDVANLDISNRKERILDDVLEKLRESSKVIGAINKADLKWIKKSIEGENPFCEINEAASHLHQLVVNQMSILKIRFDNLAKGLNDSSEDVGEYCVTIPEKELNDFIKSMESCVFILKEASKINSNWTKIVKRAEILSMATTVEDDVVGSWKKEHDPSGLFDYEEI